MLLFEEWISKIIFLITQLEIEIVMGYLPSQLSEDEFDEIVRQAGGGHIICRKYNVGI